MGCWQPHFGCSHPKGDVYKFRMSLWKEHFRSLDPAFITPGSLSCIRRVKEFGLKNWEMYTGPTGSVTLGQIIVYPLDVKKDGEVTTLEGCESFHILYVDCPKFKKKFQTTIYNIAILK